MKQKRSPEGAKMNKDSDTYENIKRGGAVTHETFGRGEVKRRKVGLGLIQVRFDDFGIISVSPLKLSIIDQE